MTKKIIIGEILTHLSSYMTIEFDITLELVKSTKINPIISYEDAKAIIEEGYSLIIHSNFIHLMTENELEETCELIKFQNNWNKEKLFEFLKIRKEYNNNHLHAGTKNQTILLKERFTLNDSDVSYSACTNYLKTKKLLIDFNYTYGDGWLFQPLPDTIINYIKNL